MSHTETRIVTKTAEVILLTGDGRNHQGLCKVAADIHAHTKALVIVDHLGKTTIEKLDPAKMREFGWVRIEELEALQADRRVFP